MIRHLSFAGLALLAGACSSSQPRVQMVGPERDVAALSGQWAGDYSSSASGRSGSISFTLRAQGDSAFGDVVMVPAEWGRALEPWRDPARQTGARPQATSLTIRFVRVEGNQVSGTLEPYAEPGTGARLVTSFSGLLSGNTIDGTYTTRLASGDTQTGRWTVQRR